MTRVVAHEIIMMPEVTDYDNVDRFGGGSMGQQSFGIQSGDDMTYEEYASYFDNDVP